jgi:hypothetical protein
MEIEGKIIQELPLLEGVSKAGNPWKKKEWVLETLGEYPRKVKFDLFGDRVDNVKLEIGHTYALTFDLESREFNGRWYTDVHGRAAREIGVQPVETHSPLDSQNVAAPSFDPNETSDDLPF